MKLHESNSYSSSKRGASRTRPRLRDGSVCPRCFSPERSPTGMAVMAGNKRYETADDLPKSVPVFPLSGALLLPSGQLPLNIFEPRYLAMVDAAMAGDRLIGM